MTPSRTEHPMSDDSPRRPREIRVGWTEALMWDDGTPCNGGLWRLDTPFNRELLHRAMAHGTKLFGVTGHWLEERYRP